ncbi:hypothetical protein HS088_TW22G00706 [Tripterygium wilfordii]|uniref:Uncharacterized protein n=1 Tax=Tripterygium wilfordii TaxID=458696 RepID=A0A7J7BYN8_TRIWF|nr:hypothetical protein HS088_TW22G00706 [Tripterygium wilfordii]
MPSHEHRVQYRGDREIEEGKQLLRGVWYVDLLAESSVSRESGNRRRKATHGERHSSSSSSHQFLFKAYLFPVLIQSLLISIGFEEAYLFFFHSNTEPLINRELLAVKIRI